MRQPGSPAVTARVFSASSAWLLDPGVCYLNHGSFGACPAEVVEYRSKLLRLIEREPVDFLTGRLHHELSIQISSLESFLGAQEGTLVMTENTTSGVNSVIGSLLIGRGDSVLLSEQAYFSTRNALIRRAAQVGARVRTIRFRLPCSSPESLIDDVIEALDPSVRYAVLDHISSPTGMVFPIDGIVKALGERGVEVIVDGAHGPGHLPVRLSETGCGWYIGNCHKWLCSPRSSAVIYTRPDLKHLTMPAVTSRLPGDYAPGPDPGRVMFDWWGTPDPTPKLCVKPTMEYMATLHPLGWPGIMDRNNRLALAARELLHKAVETPLPYPVSMVGCMASVLLPSLEPPRPVPVDWCDPLQRSLRDRGFQVPVIHCGGLRFLRISAQLYNRLDEYERLSEALTELL